VARLSAEFAPSAAILLAVARHSCWGSRRSHPIGQPASTRQIPGHFAVQPIARSTRQARSVTQRLGAPGVSMSTHIFPAYA
jgi:hypothetical protein